MMSNPSADWEELPGGTKSVRPRLQIERTKWEIICETIAAVIMASLTLYLTVSWASLPVRIPAHFNFSGQVDAWGDKHALLIIWGITCVLYVGLSILLQFPHIYNYPFKLTAQNVRRQYPLARQLLAFVTVGVVGFLAFIMWQIIWVAKGNAPHFQPLFFSIHIPVIIVAIVVYFFKAKRAI